jgi:3-deoxy-D-manno-octulosonate 8-phosphate phosphatase (KDO 8-P phosphatase)
VRRRAPRPDGIKLLVLDVDGVLTDGSLLLDSAGRDWKRFHVHDGVALVAAQRAGIRIAIVSGRASPAVSRRMAEIGIRDVHQGVADKAAAARALMRRFRVVPAEVAAMGDDLPDLGLMREVGLRLAPANAVREVRRMAHWVSRRAGGEGAVREAIEMLLRARGAWPPTEPKTSRP